MFTAAFPEDKVRQLIGDHGFTIANLSQCLTNEGKIVECRMVIRSQARANAKLLADRE